MYFLLRRLIWSVQKIFPEICQRREDWERSINYPGIESSASRYIIEFLVWNMKYEMNLSHSRRFMRSYCRWSVQNKNFGHDPSPRYRGNHGWRNKDILGGQERLLWSKFTWFLRFLLSGVSKTAATTTISYKTNNLGSFKEMTNVHQGWKEKGEVVTFWEGRKWRGNGEWRWPIWLS